MKNITLSADEHLIESARRRAAAEQTTLNEQFRAWLATYAHARERLQRYDDAISSVKGRMQVGKKLSRDEMNER